MLDLQSCLKEDPSCLSAWKPQVRMVRSSYQHPIATWHWLPGSPMLREETTQKAHVPVGSSCDSGQKSLPVFYHSNDLRWDNRGGNPKKWPKSWRVLSFEQLPRLFLASLKLKFLYLARCGSCSNLRSPWMNPKFLASHLRKLFGIRRDSQQAF